MVVVVGGWRCGGEEKLGWIERGREREVQVKREPSFWGGRSGAFVWKRRGNAGGKRGKDQRKNAGRWREVINGNTVVKKKKKMMNDVCGGVIFATKYNITLEILRALVELIRTARWSLISLFSDVCLLGRFTSARPAHL